MTQPIDRKPIFITLIDSYLPQLTEDDLYKLHDLVRNTVESRKAKTDAAAPTPPTNAEEADATERVERRTALERGLKRLYSEEPVYYTNRALFDETNLSEFDPRSQQIFAHRTLVRFSNIVRNEVARLQLNTAPYGIMTSAWAGNGDEGVDIFFGVRGVFDGCVRLAWTSGQIVTTVEDRRMPGEKCLSFVRTDKLSEANLLSPLRKLDERYKQGLKRQ